MNAMKSLLMSAALAGALLLPAGGANAAVIGNLGVNPTSAQVTSPAAAGGACPVSKTSLRSNWSARRNSSPLHPLRTCFPPRRTSSPTSRLRCGPPELTASSTTADDVVVIGPVAATRGARRHRELPVRGRDRPPQRWALLSWNLRAAAAAPRAMVVISLRAASPDQSWAAVCPHWSQPLAACWLGAAGAAAPPKARNVGARLSRRLHRGSAGRSFVTGLFSFGLLHLARQRRDAGARRPKRHERLPCWSAAAFLELGQSSRH